MGTWEWVILILALLFVFLCFYAIRVLFDSNHKNYVRVRKAIPLIILVVIIGYSGVSLYRYYDYMSSPNATLAKLFTHTTTYTTIVNFVTLLAFYQVLVDRVEKLKEKKEVENLEEGIPISNFKVITYSEHKKLVKKAENAIHEKYRSKK